MEIERRTNDPKDIIIETSVDIKIKDNQDNDHDHDHESTMINWRNVLMRYLWSVFITGFFFGLQQDGKFHKNVIALGFLHFAAELEPVYYLLINRKIIAQRLVIITYCIHFIEAIMVWCFPISMYTIFQLQFLFSDAINFITAMRFIFLAETNKTLSTICTALSLHMIGVIWSVLVTFVSWFYPNDPDMTNGFGWLTITGTSLLQLYLVRNIIRNNEPVRIPKLRIFQKLSIFGVLILIGISSAIARQFRLQHDDRGWDEYVWGDSVEIMAMRICAPIFAFIGMYGSCYYYRIADQK